MNLKVVQLNDVAIAIALARKRMTRKELCDMTNINQGNFSTMMKRGKVRPKTAGTIAAALDVDVTEIILTGDEAKNG